MEKLKSATCWFSGTKKNTESAVYSCFVEDIVIPKTYMVNRYSLNTHSEAQSEGYIDGNMGTTVHDVYCFKRDTQSKSGLYYVELVCSDDIKQIADMDDGSKGAERLGYTLEELNKVKAYGEL